MSAAHAWDSTPDIHLCTRVRSGETARPTRHLQVVRQSAQRSHSRQSLRVTRLGRLVLTLLLAAVVTTAALSAWAGAAASGSSSGPIIDHSTTVRAGQTLSEIAVRELPALPVDEGVWALQLANNLSSAHIETGQVLRIPAVG